MASLRISLDEDRESTHDLTEDKITVGRLADNVIQIDDGSVSSHHAEMVLENGEYHLHDLGSTNGTFVNEQQLTDAILKHGDLVRFGKINCTFLSEESSGPGQPLPESADNKAEAGANSSRPADFRNTSPFPKEVREKDPIAALAMIVAILGSLAAVAAAVFAFVALETPQF